MKLGEDVDLEAVYKMNYYFCVVPRFEDQSNHPMIKPSHVQTTPRAPEGRADRSEAEVLRVYIQTFVPILHIFLLGVVVERRLAYREDPGSNPARIFF